MLNKKAAAHVSDHLTKYADAKAIYMKINFVNADHVHALVDLPTNLSMEELIQLLKGNSSHWINANNLLQGKFAWGRGYGAFSVSESKVTRVAAYIAGQENIIASVPSLTSYGTSLSVTACAGKMSKAVETVSVFRG